VKLRHVLQITAATVGIIAASIGVNVYWQYRTARPPALDSIPIYSTDIAVPLTEIPEPQRANAETQLHNFVATVRPGYRVADERFLATKGPFTWDAVRHDIESQLRSTGYVLDKNGDSTDHTMTYSAYQHHGLRQRFNNDMVVGAGFDRTTLKTVAADEVYLYGYFRLTPS
jgi:hypothetical protein